MADNENKQHDIYNVVDKDGNVVGKQIYPHGGSLYSGTKFDRENDKKTEVYYSGTQQQILPLKEAITDTRIEFNPSKNTLTLIGPDFATKKIKESDWFKQNYANSGTLSRAISLANSNPNAQLQMQDGSTKTISEVLQNYKDSFSDYTQSYAGIADMKDRIETVYGSSLSDEQVQIAGLSYDKKDYDSNGAVYLTKRMTDKYDFSRFGSYDPDKRTISAKDFFDGFYQLKFADIGQDWGHTGAVIDLQNDIIDQVNDFLQAGKWENDERNADPETTRAMLNDEEYKEELARTLSMANTISANSPEADGLMQFAVFNTSFIGGLWNGIENTGMNAMTVATDLASLPSKIMTDVVEGITGMSEDDSRGIGIALSAPTALLATGLTIAGDIFRAGNFDSDNAKQSGSYSDEFAKNFSEDMLALGKTTGNNAWSELADEVNGAFGNFKGDMQQIHAGSAIAGETLGQISWKIAEQIMLVNALGTGMSEKVVSMAPTVAADAAKAGLTTPFTLATFDAKSIGTALGAITNIPKGAVAVSGVVKALAFSTNVVSQGILETILDNGQAVHNLLNTGDTEVFQIIAENTAANAIFEGIGPTRAALAKTLPGKTINSAMLNVTNRLGSWKDSMTHKLFDFIHKNSDGKFVNEAGVHFKVEADQLKSDFLAESARSKKAAADVDIIKEAATAEPGKKMEAFTDAIAKQQEIISKRVVLQNAFDLMNASIRSTSRVIEGQLDSKTVTSFYKNLKGTYEASQALIKNGKLHTGLKDDFLPKEAKEYLSIKAQLVKLNNKKKLSPNELLKKVSMEGRSDELVKLFGTEYQGTLDSLYRSISHYQHALNNYKIDHNLFDPEGAAAIQGMRNDGLFGLDGIDYVHTQRIKPGENYSDIITRSQNLYNGKELRSARTNKALAELDSGDEFADPVVLLFGDLVSSTSIMVQRTWQKALFNSAGVTKKFVASGDEYKTAKNFSKTFKAASKDFKITDNSFAANAIRDAFEGNDVLAKAYNRTATSKKALAKAKQGVKRTSERIAEIYKLDQASTYTRLTKSMSADDIAELNKALRVYKVPDFDLTDMSAAEFKEWYKNLPDNTKTLISNKLNGRNSNLTNVRALLNDPESGEKMRLILQRNYIANNKRITNSNTYKDIIRRMREAEITGRLRTSLDLNVKNHQKYLDMIRADKKDGVDALAGEAATEFRDSLVNTTSGIIDQLSEVVKKNESMMAIVKKFGEEGVDEDVAVRFITLRQLNNLSRGDIKKALKKSDFAQKALLDVSPKIKLESSNHYIDNMADALKKNIKSEYNSMLENFSANDVTNVIDPDELYDTVSKHMKKISGEVAEKNVIAVPSGVGKVEYFQTDPLTAHLYVAKPGSFVRQITDYGDGAQRIIKFFNRTNRIFNWGTTGFSLKSFVNQWFRDPLNAISIGGARPFLDFGVGVTNQGAIFGHGVSGKITNEFVNTYGDSIVKGLKEEYGAEWWARFEKNAKATGDVKRAAVEFEVKSSGFGSLPGQEMLTTIGYYEGGSITPKQGKEIDTLRKSVDKAYGARMNRLFGDGSTKEAQGMISRAVDAISKKQLGQWRETYLRQNVYVSSYARALDSGMAPTLARQYATRYALDATTDFARPIFIGDSLAKAIPYFGAAVNGAESFWRLIELDPGGVAGRIIGGIILPVMAGLTESLSDPTNVEVYKNIPEYEKEDSAVFVIHGEKVTIPLPQEMSAFVAPFRHAVEKAHDANDISWTALLTSDLLQIVPGFDLSGFVNLDANKLLSEPSVMDNIQRGAEKLMSGIMPSTAKGLYKLATGRDPYSGREIDRSYVYYDENGERQIMDTTQSQFAQWLSSVFGNELSPSAAYSICKDIIGQSFMDLNDGIVETIQSGNVGKGLYTTANKALGEVAGVMSDEVYLKSKSDWYYAMRELEKQKNAIIMDKQFQNVASKISRAETNEERRKWQGAYDDYIVKYRQQVVDIVNNLKQKYPGTYDRSKQAAVLSALNFSVSTSRGSNAYSRQLSQEQYYTERAAAIQTMQKLGFTNTEDNSILGYGVVDQYGKYSFKWNSPLVILDAGNVVFGQEDMHIAGLQEVLDANEITRSKMFSKEYYALTSKSDKMAYKNAWNAKVIRALAPYVRQYGVEAVLEQYGVRDMLDNYLFVDPYKTKEYLYKIFGGDN